MCTRRKLFFSDFLYFLNERIRVALELDLKNEKLSFLNGKKYEIAYPI
jgi:hypothetical protein